MRYSGLLILLAILMGSFVSCSDKSSNPGNQPVRASLYQVGRCQSHGLDNVSSIDSCISYQFTDKLTVDFCLVGNCCPDSNRFKFSNEISHDTIFVAVTDTAERNCNCFCNYTARAEFDNLPLDRYVFYCTRIDDGNRVIYCVEVHRGAGM